MMRGSSPYANGYQSPSYHSSSYLPKLEANFMKDFNCCGIILASLHDLLQHYEEAHASQAPPAMLHQPTIRQSIPNPNAGTAASQAQNGGQQQDANQRPQQMNISGQEAAMAAQQNAPRPTPSVPQAPVPAPPAPDMEAVEDMEMDDGNEDPISATMASNLTQNQLPLADRGGLYGQRAQYGPPPAARMPGLNLDTSQQENPLQHFQGIRHSQPNTPVAGGRPAPVFHNNPTVSSVNTPTLSTHSSAHPRHPRQLAVAVGLGTPDSSAPGTPRELDHDFVSDVQNMSMDNGMLFGAAPGGIPITNPAAFGYGAGAATNQLYIDEPAKALAHPHGHGGADSPKQVPPGKNRMGSAHYGPDDPIAKIIREQQRKVGLADTVEGINGGEPKPFRCPVIGCEKAYKNQNGLKYHKAVCIPTTSYPSS